MRNLGFKNSLPKKGYRLVNLSNRDSPYIHLFCGKSELKNAISPITGFPLLRFLSLDTSDPRLELEALSIKRIELLYSLTCSISSIDFFYKVGDDHIDILNFDTDLINSKEVYTDVPFEDYPVYFPQVRVDLIPVYENERVIVKEINETDNFDLELEYPHLSEPYHQLGGEPYFIQKPNVLACPICGNDMLFFASIGNNNGQAKGFFDNDYMQVIYQICKKCQVIGAYNRCD